MRQFLKLPVQYRKYSQSLIVIRSPINQAKEKTRSLDLPSDNWEANDLYHLASRQTSIQGATYPDGGSTFSLNLLRLYLLQISQGNAPLQTLYHTLSPCHCLCILPRPLHFLPPLCSADHAGAAEGVNADPAKFADMPKRYAENIENSQSWNQPDSRDNESYHRGNQSYKKQHTDNDADVLQTVLP